MSYGGTEGYTYSEFAFRAQLRVRGGYRAKAMEMGQAMMAVSLSLSRALCSTTLFFYRLTSLGINLPGVHVDRCMGARTEHHQSGRGDRTRRGHQRVSACVRMRAARANATCYA